MKKLTLPLLGLIMITLFSGCGLMEDAFKAGIFFTLVIVIIVGLIIWLSRFVINQLTKRQLI